MIVRAIDQETTNASGAHLSEGGLLLAGEFGHGAIEARWRPSDNRESV
jgi:hypothetical protein